SFTQDSDMVRRVPRGEKCQGAHRKRFVTGDSASHPRIRWHVLVKRKRREPHPSERLNVRGPSNSVGICAGDGHVLIETRQRSLEAASKPQRAKSDKPFRVVEVVQHLPDAPFVRRVAVQRLLLRNCREESWQFFELPWDRARPIDALNLVDISEIVWRRGAGLRQWYHACLPTASAC